MFCHWFVWNNFLAPHFLLKTFRRLKKKILKFFTGATNQNCWHFLRNTVTSKGIENGWNPNKTLYFKKLNSLENAISFRFFQHQKEGGFRVCVCVCFLTLSLKLSITCFALNCNYHIGSDVWQERSWLPPGALPQCWGCWGGWLSRHVFIWLATVTWHLYNQSIPIFNAELWMLTISGLIIMEILTDLWVKYQVVPKTRTPGQRTEKFSSD